MRRQHECATFLWAKMVRAARKHAVVQTPHRSLPAALEGLIRATMGIRVKRSTIESWNYGQALEDYDDDEVVE